MTGTSMAAPMVTAVAAMVYSYQEDLSLSEVKDKLLSSVTKLTSLDGKVATGGMLNAYNAVTSN
jgi:subtilisin family serine protease